MMEHLSEKDPVLKIIKEGTHEEQIIDKNEFLTLQRNDSLMKEEQTQIERISLPGIEKKKPLNDNIALMLYNRYLMFLRELDSYKNKIVYFLDDPKGEEGEQKLVELNLDLDSRIKALGFKIGEIEGKLETLE